MTPRHVHAGHHSAGHHSADHPEEDIDWNAMGDHLEREAELHLPFLEQAAAWLAESQAGGVADRAGTVTYRRILDVGSGPGVATCVLARAFPDAEAVAVDGAAALLERARARAAAQSLGDRLVVRQADLPEDVPSLGPADLIFSSKAVHHLGDQQAALRSLAERLRPGGLLAVAEGGLPQRFLPRDIGIGRPGLQARLDAVHEDVFTEMREELPGAAPVVEDWPAMLAAAGLTPAGSRTFVTDRPAPADTAVREHLFAYLTRLRDRLGDRLDAEDGATLDVLLDPAEEAGVLRRPDVFFLTATTVHTARASH